MHMVAQYQMNPVTYLTISDALLEETSYQRDQCQDLSTVIDLLVALYLAWLLDFFFSPWFEFFPDYCSSVFSSVLWLPSWKRSYYLPLRKEKRSGRTCVFLFPFLSFFSFSTCINARRHLLLTQASFLFFFLTCVRDHISYYLVCTLKCLGVLMFLLIP